MNLAYVNQQNSRIDENGGATALRGNKNHTEATLSTLGLRTGYEWQIGSTDLTLNSELGWQHQYGKTDRDVALTFNGSNTPFVVKSVAASRDGAVLMAEAKLAVTKNVKVSLSYNGLLSPNQQNNSLSAGFSLSF